MKKLSQLCVAEYINTTTFYENSYRKTLKTLQYFYLVAVI